MALCSDRPFERNHAAESPLPILRLPASLSTDHLIRLSRHLLEAGRTDEGMTFVLPALERLRRAARNEEVARLAQLALGSREVVPDADHVDVAIAWVTAQEALGNREARQAAIELALGLSSRLGDLERRLRVNRSWGSHCRDFDDNRGVDQALEEGLAMARDSENVSWMGSLLRLRGEVLAKRGHVEKAIEVLQRARELMRSNRDRETEAIIRCEL